MANDIAQAHGGFGQEDNEVKIIDGEGKVEELPLLPKAEVAEIVLDRAVELMKQDRGTPARGRAKKV